MRNADSPCQTTASNDTILEVPTQCPLLPPRSFKRNLNHVHNETLNADTNTVAKLDIPQRNAENENVTRNTKQKAPKI